MKAAVFHGPHQPLTIEDVEIDAPGPHEVLVRTAATGVCHSDLHFVEGLYPAPAPAILGHEAAGIVEQVGELVSYVAPGDHVIACLSVFCGHCERCLTGHPSLCTNPETRRGKNEPPKLSQGGVPITQMFNISSYAEKML
ncbi:MAG: alcohol dehydrogenase catalytic domain-containing protein, partial [Candidatus Dormibacterales bacterium]